MNEIKKVALCTAMAWFILSGESHAQSLDQSSARLAVEFAQIAIKVYDNAAAGRWNVSGKPESNSTTGFNAATYTSNQSPNVIVIAFRGTEFGVNADGLAQAETLRRAGVQITDGDRTILSTRDKQDAVTDVQVLLGKKPSQFAEADRYVQRVQRENPGKEIVLVGHSLGGALAQYAAAKNGNEAYTFNSLGLNTALLSDIDNGTKLVRPVHNIISLGDRVSELNAGNQLKYLGNDRKYIDVGVFFDKALSTVNAPNLGAWVEHSMEPLAKAIQATAFPVLPLTSLTSPTANSTTMAFVPSIPTTPATSVNSNLSPNGASATVTASSANSTDHNGTIVYGTSASTADYNLARQQMMQISGNRMDSFSFAVLGQVGRGSANGAQFVDTSSAPDGDGTRIYWGRWVGAATSVTAANGAAVNGNTVHWMFGAPVFSGLPQNRIFTYSAIGGTQFSSNSGNTLGQFFLGGTITVNTGTTAVSLNDFRFGYTNPAGFFGAAIFSMSGKTNYFSANTGSPSQPGFRGTLNGNCAGGLCTATGITATGAFAGRFTGDTGTGIALSYGAITNNHAVGGTGVQAFKR